MPRNSKLPPPLTHTHRAKYLECYQNTAPTDKHHLCASRLRCAVSLWCLCVCVCVLACNHRQEEGTYTKALGATQPASAFLPVDLQWCSSYPTFLAFLFLISSPSSLRQPLKSVYAQAQTNTYNEALAHLKRSDLVCVSLRCCVPFAVHLSASASGGEGKGEHTHE